MRFGGMIFKKWNTPEEWAQAALEAARAARAAVESAPPELYAEDIRRAWESLGAISGETANEKVIDEIFSKFCVGK